MKQREKTILTADRPRLKETLQCLAQLYEATGQSEKAAEWRKILMEFEQGRASQTSSDPNQRTTTEKKYD